MVRTRSESDVVSRIAHDGCVGSPVRRFSRAWWDELETDFAKQPEPFELGWRDRLLVRASAALDVGVRTVTATAVGVLTLPVAYHPLRFRQMQREGDFYRDVASTGDASRFFRPPTGRRVVKVRKARSALFRPPDGACEVLTFDSGFVPCNPANGWRHGEGGRNDTVHVRLWRHEGRPRPTLIVLHGFGAEKGWINELVFALPRLYRMGCDVALLTMPFHGRRGPKLAPFSGYGFFSAGLAGINESFAQAVHDCRVLIDHLLDDRGVPAVAAAGISLGGTTCGLLAACEPRLSLIVPIVPVVSLADLIMEWRPLSTAVRSIGALSGLSLEDLRHMTAVTSPITWQPAVDTERLMIIGGVGDRMAPPKHARLLWEHWRGCRLHWFPGGHLLHMDQHEYMREIGRFMVESGFVSGSTPGST